MSSQNVKNLLVQEKRETDSPISLLFSLPIVLLSYHLLSHVGLEHGRNSDFSV